MRKLVSILLLLAFAISYKVQGQPGCYQVLRTLCPAETIELCNYDASECINLSTANTQTYDVYKWEQKRIDWAYDSDYKFPEGSAFVV